MTITRATMALARWLGPWADASASPRNVEVERVTRGGCRLDVYRGRAPEGAFVLVPGLHYDGIDDARFVRFARVLAGSGLCVVAVHLESYRALEPAPSATDEVASAFDAARDEVGRPPVGMSISFGCLPLIQAAARQRADELGGVITFGGYGDWATTLLFALEGAPGVPSDPLNRPVVYLNLLEALEVPADRVAVRAAWNAYVRATWGRDEMRRGGEWRGVAQRISGTLGDPETRALFEIGVGLREDDGAAVAALERGDWSRLELREAASRIAAPIRVLHGVSDDVIPVSQADVLADAFTASRDVQVYRTGAFEHTGGAGHGMRDAWRELRTTLAMLRALASLPRSGTLRSRGPTRRS